MKLFLEKKNIVNTRGFMRSCGYAELHDARTGTTSYAKSLSGRAYPRFHVYLDEQEQQLVVNLHLDQKQASYEGHTAHSGEYGGDLVEQEGKRIKAEWENILHRTTKEEKQKESKKGFFRKLLGF